MTNELSDVRSITPSPVRNALSLAHSDDDDAGSYYGDEDDTLPSHIHRPALDQLSPSRDFGVLNAMDEAHVNGSVGSTGSARRPLPRVPAPMATLKEQAEQSSPEIGLHQPPPSRLPIPVSTSDTSIFSLPDIPDPSPLLIDVERLGRDTSSAPPTLEGERARLQPEGRQPVLAQRGKSPLPDSGIAARPPLKPRAATVSDTRIPTLNLESRASSSSGGESTPRIRQGDDDLPLSPSHLDSLSSPLEKLISQSSSTGEYEGACDASDDSIEESVYAGVQGDMSPSEQLESHRRALLKQRRESKLAAEANGSLEMPNGRPGRRRSLSTGDKPLVRSSLQV